MKERTLRPQPGQALRCQGRHPDRPHGLCGKKLAHVAPQGFTVRRETPETIPRGGVSIRCGRCKAAWLLVPTGERAAA